jgi:hypothetical protein
VEFGDANTIPVRFEKWMVPSPKCHNLIPAILVKPKPFIFLDIGKNRDVGLEFEKISEDDVGIADRNRDFDFRVASMERDQHLRRVKRADGADPEMTSTQFPALRQKVPGLGFVGEHASGDLPELSARVGETNISASAHEEFDRILLLKLANLSGQRRLTDIKLVCGRGDVFCLGNGMKGSELCISHWFFGYSQEIRGCAR